LKDVLINGKEVGNIYKAKGLKNEEHMAFDDYIRLLNKNEIFKTTQPPKFFLYVKLQA
jgi:hypothetical protein